MFLLHQSPRAAALVGTAATVLRFRRTLVFKIQMANMRACHPPIAVPRVWLTGNV